MSRPRWIRGAVTACTLALTAGTLLASPTPAYAADPLTIAEVQGTGEATPYAGDEVTLEPSVVTAVYGQGGSAEFRGFVVQTPGSGGRAKKMDQASDAVFVYMGNTAFNLEIGDAVNVTGTAGEFNGLTQIGGTVTVSPADGTFAEPEPVRSTRWERTASQRENLESMLYDSNERFIVSDTYPLLPYGELGLSAGKDLPVQPTDVGTPGSPEAEEQAAQNSAIQVNLDDGTNRGFTRTDQLDARTLPYLSTKRDVTVGDVATLTEPVIIDFRNNKWKFNPTRPIEAGDEVVRIRSLGEDRSPKVGGDLSIASFNVLNYFTTVGEGREGCTGSNLDTADSYNVTYDCDVRGAWDPDDLERQQTKIVKAINKLGAAVVGLMEIENSAKLGEETDEATASLVAALNADAGERKWAFVASSSHLQDVADQDVITNALIYQVKQAKVNGPAYALGAQSGDDGAFGNARTPIAASFTARKGGERTLVVVNHFKSKGSGDDATGDNADSGDGQGAWNGDRTRAAQALVDWLPEVQEDFRAKSVALVGDFNSYSQEDPMQVLYDAGFANAAPDETYSYNFSGLAGSLDHVLLNDAADQRRTGADIWNINSGESQALEYSTYKTTSADYYQPTPKRSSDHDPVIVGLKAGEATETDLTLLNFNDFHGRIAQEEPNTVGYFGTIEEQRELAGEDNTLLFSAGDSLGGSLFTSSVQQDQPTIEALNAIGLEASAVGNHEFDKGFADLDGRVKEAADWTYLGANVYEKGTTTPALPEYHLVEKAGLTVGVIGAVTEETPTLVSADGVKDLDFGDPVEAVNRVAAQLTDGDEANGEADVLVAEYHEGATEGGESSTLEDQVAKGGAFADIVEKTSPVVAAIFTAHTHQAYAWDAPIPGAEGKTRPILQAESYAALLGKVTLTIDNKTGEVTSYTRENVEPTSTPNEELIKNYPRVAEVSTIVDDAIVKAEEIGSVVIGEAGAPITRAFSTDDQGNQVEDRGSESTISNLVGNMLRDQLADPARGGAQIGVQNPGGNRADFDQGDITFAEAAGILPFANSLYTLDLTGEQFTTLLEQQWQTNEDGTPCDCSRPYLQLGLSDNVTYTYDADQPHGSRITSVTIDGKPLDPAATYRVATPSFLTTGGDNFHAFKDATNVKDAGLIDLDSWTDYVKAKTPLSPSFAKQAVAVKDLPSEVTAGAATEFTVSSLDFTSLESPATTSLTVELNGTEIGTATVLDGEATVQVDIPADAATGAGTLVLTSDTSSVVTIPVTIT